MKIAKLTKDHIGRYDIAELSEKINEIIDVLNKSFITDDPDTIYGETVSVDNLQSVVDITCDTIIPLQNEHTLKCNTKCPHCGESYYTELYSASTAVYYPPIYKDGVNINPDMNKATTHCRCLNCGKEFDI
jgi:hypothetical protein